MQIRFLTLALAVAAIAAPTEWTTYNPVDGAVEDATPSIDGNGGVVTNGGSGSSGSGGASGNGSGSSNGGGTGVCGGDYDVPLCCATDVLGVADLNCEKPHKSQLPSADDLTTVCAAQGQQAKCCVLPILGQALLCVDAY